MNLDQQIALHFEELKVLAHRLLLRRDATLQTTALVQQQRTPSSARTNLGIHAMAGLRRPAELDVGLAWVREAAAGNRALRFDNLLHHVTVSRLELAYRSLRKDAASGVDEEDWLAYGIGLEERLVQLHEAVQSGRYRPHPVLRQWALKPDGRKRPLGVTCVEDKIVQKALVWVLDADIEACFDRIEHSKLLAVLGRRLSDRRVLHLIEQTLKAGVVDDGKWQASKVGVPQGAVISPLLANVFLHDAIDRWVQGWRGHWARGMVSIVRYADDFVIGFQYRDDGARLHSSLGKRLALYGLTLHPDKTRRHDSGRFRPRTGPSAGRGNRRRSTFWASRTAAAHDVATASLRCAGYRSPSVCERSAGSKWMSHVPCLQAARGSILAMASPAKSSAHCTS